MDERQQNIRHHTLRTLECISFIDALLTYKRNVPFVHIGYELLEQSETIERYLTWDWFRAMWTDEQLLALEEFVRVYVTTSDLFNKDVPDMPELLEDERWLHFMGKSQELLQRIRDVDEDVDKSYVV